MSKHDSGGEVSVTGNVQINLPEPVEVNCRQAGRGRHSFKFKYGRKQHADTFPVTEHWLVRKCGAEVCNKFGAMIDGDPDPRAIETLDAAILNAVDRLNEKIAMQIDDPAERIHQPVVRRLSDVQPRPVKWLWPGRIALGKLTIFAGDPGLGKSYLSLDIAARVTTGCKWPDCDSDAPLGSVVLLSAEDDLEDTIRPRLDAAAADVDKIVALEAVRAADGKGNYERPLDLQRDLATIESVVASSGNCKLVVIDPISAYLGKTDSHNNADVRAALAPISAMAARLGVAVVAVSHLSKGDTKAIYKVMGSLGFIAAARAGWIVVKDKRKSNRRLFLPIKNNLGNDQSGLAFELSARYGDGQPCVVWEAEPVTTTADEAMAPEQGKRGRPAEDRDGAAKFLKTALGKGPRLATEIQTEAQEAHGIAKRTLMRAKSELKVEAYQPTNPGPWWWRLPDRNQAADSPPVETIWHSGNLGGNAEETCSSEPPECQIANIPMAHDQAADDGLNDDPDEAVNQWLTDAAETDGEGF